MNHAHWSENLTEQKVIYTFELNGNLYVVENVPARVNLETGEQLFAPETVERLQALIWANKQPARMMQVPVYEYA